MEKKEEALMKMAKWKIETIYEGRCYDELLLPEGVEIESISAKYGGFSIVTTGGDELKMIGSQFVDWDTKRPIRIDFKKESS